MDGETELKTILKNLSPILLQETWVFCTFEKARYGDFADLSPMASVMEDRGLTLVLSKGAADAKGFEYQGEFSCISLQVQSSLNTVGLTAIVSGILAAYEISVNIVAGYHHDHLFVPVVDAPQALHLLKNLDNLG